MKGGEGGQQLLSSEIWCVFAELLFRLLVVASLSGVSGLLAGCVLQNRERQCLCWRPPPQGTGALLLPTTPPPRRAPARGGGKWRRAPGETPLHAPS